VGGVRLGNKKRPEKKRAGARPAPTSKAEALHYVLGGHMGLPLHTKGDPANRPYNEERASSTDFTVEEISSSVWRKPSGAGRVSEYAIKRLCG